MGKPVSIVIPTINEVTGIPRTIQKIPVDRLKMAGCNVEVIVVDGGSTDGTTLVAEKLGARVIAKPRLGYGRVYRTAFSEAKGEVTVTLDGDGTYPAELIPRLVGLLLRKNHEFITTSRISPGNPTSMRLVNRIGNWILSVISRVLFDRKLLDSQSGTWIFRKEILRDIMPNSDGMPFSEEIKVRRSQHVKQAIEVLIPYRTGIGAPKLRTFRGGLRNLCVS